MPSPSPTESRRPGRPRDAGRDEAILKATLELVSADGLPALTVDAVAAKAGVSKATIYRRWSSKEAMLLDAWRELTVPIETPDTGSVRDDLVALYDDFARKLRGGTLARVMPHMHAAAQVDADLGRQYRAFLAERRKPLVLMVQRAIARGELPAGTDAEFVQELIHGPLYFRAVVIDRPVPRSHVEQLVDFALNGLRAADAALNPA